MNAPTNPELLSAEANCIWWADRAEWWQAEEHFWLDMAATDGISDAKREEYKLQARIAMNYVNQAELKCMGFAAELEAA